MVQVSQHDKLVVLDPRPLTDKQLEKCNDIFNEFKEQSFRPANQARIDKTRKALDEAILIELLGLSSTTLESVELIRSSWCAEPSVRN